mgnify:CR=1 FL=1
MGTFADLMSLLMCFFVLLLSFSEMDVLKFKQIAGSMKFAFGVQNKIEVKDIPKGTSVIAMEFRPGRPEPTPIETIQQQTTTMTQEMLEFQAGNETSAGGRQKQRGEQRGGAAQQTASEQQTTSQNASQEEVAERMRKVAQQLEKQIIEATATAIKNCIFDDIDVRRSVCLSAEGTGRRGDCGGFWKEGRIDTGGCVDFCA